MSFGQSDLEKAEERHNHSEPQNSPLSTSGNALSSRRRLPSNSLSSCHSPEDRGGASSNHEAASSEASRFPPITKHKLPPISQLSRSSANHHDTSSSSIPTQPRQILPSIRARSSNSNSTAHLSTLQIAPSAQHHQNNSYIYPNPAQNSPPQLGAYSNQIASRPLLRPLQHNHTVTYPPIQPHLSFNNRSTPHLTFLPPNNGQFTANLPPASSRSWTPIQSVDPNFIPLLTNKPSSKTKMSSKRKRNTEGDGVKKQKTVSGALVTKRVAKSKDDLPEPVSLASHLTLPSFL